MQASKYERVGLLWKREFGIGWLGSRIVYLVLLLRISTLCVPVGSVRSHTYCHRTRKIGHPAFNVMGSDARLWVDRRKGEAEPVAKVIECAQGRYEVQDVELGKVYKWRPERIVVECGCGERLYLNASTTTSCKECTTDHALTVRAELADRRERDDQVLHPWRYSYYSEDREDAGLPF